MLRSLVMLAAAGALLAACTSKAPAAQTAVAPAAVPAEKLQRCDDGGEGGVMIRGVCL